MPLHAAHDVSHGRQTRLVSAYLFTRKRGAADAGCGRFETNRRRRRRRRGGGLWRGGWGRPRTSPRGTPARPSGNSLRTGSGRSRTWCKRTALRRGVRRGGGRGWASAGGRARAGARRMLRRGRRLLVGGERTVFAALVLEYSSIVVKRTVGAAREAAAVAGLARAGGVGVAAGAACRDAPLEGPEGQVRRAGQAGAQYVARRGAGDARRVTHLQLCGSAVVWYCS